VGNAAEQAHARIHDELGAVARDSLTRPLVKRDEYVMNAILKDPGAIHPALWRATQMPHFSGRTVPTGSAVLDAQLPGNGWPQGALIDLLLQTVGIGEMRLLAPALKTVASRPLMLLNPPHVPNQQAFLYWGLPVDHITVIRADTAADTLWAAEQILRSGTCGALLVWADKIRNENLRRLQVAAGSSTTLLFVLQPIYSQIQASPATLRLVLRPALDGVEVDIIKRRGPTLEKPFFVPIGPSPILAVRTRPTIVEFGDDDVLFEEQGVPDSGAIAQAKIREGQF
jgi:hypothetical protein